MKHEVPMVIKALVKLLSFKWEADAASQITEMLNSTTLNILHFVQHSQVKLKVTRNVLQKLQSY